MLDDQGLEDGSRHGHLVVSLVQQLPSHTLRSLLLALDGAIAHHRTFHRDFLLTAELVRQRVDDHEETVLGQEIAKGVEECQRMRFVEVQQLADAVNDCADGGGLQSGGEGDGSQKIGDNELEGQGKGEQRLYGSKKTV